MKYIHSDQKLKWLLFPAQHVSGLQLFGGDMFLAIYKMHSMDD